MKPAQLILRCYATNNDGVWEAFCLDLTLAVQGESFPEVKEKLESQITSYVNEALTKHGDYADQLLNRKAPLWSWIEYYFYLTKFKLHYLKDDMFKIFKEPMPLGVCSE
jgi:hypothetical protein